VSVPQADHRNVGRALNRATLALLLLALAFASACEGVGTWLGGRKTLAAVVLARVLDPLNPNLAIASSELLSNPAGSNTALAVDALASATRAGPNRAMNWALLAEACDLSGDAPRAQAAFQRALQLFPLSPRINWMYANFLIRSGDATRSLAPLRLAIEGDQTLRAGAFDLAWRAGLSPEQILAAVPARSDTLSAYLDYLSHTRRLTAATEVWARLVSDPSPPDLGAALHYFDSLLYAQQVDAMVDVWNVLGARYPHGVPARTAAVNLISNPGFETSPLNGGFDWRLVPVEGARAFVDSAAAREGSHSLCVIFDGTHNLEFTHVVQYVAVEPNKTYRFLAYARAQGITTDSGPRFSIYDPFDRKELSVATASMIGTFDWQPQLLDFVTGPKTYLLVLQLYRPVSRKFDSQIAGTLWVDSVSLVEQHN
jgi:hypothetical protein